MLSPNESTIAPTLPSRLACEPCRRKKTKCDMERPRCGLCRRTAIVCEFPTKRKRPTFSGKRRRTASNLDEHHLRLLARFLEENSELIKTASFDEAPEECLQLLDDIANYASPGHHEEQCIFPIDQSTDDSMPGPPSEDCDGAPSCATLGGEERSSSNSNTIQQQSQTVSHTLAVHLVEVFFDKIAPWLSLLHKPRFLQRCSYILTPGPDALVNAPLEDKILLLSMFALAARHSNHEVYSSIPFPERGRHYAQEAEEIYVRAESSHGPSLRYLQGVIVLGYYFHTSGLSSQGCIVVGVCVQLAMDLDLPQLDAENASSNQPSDAFDREERRRAWWATWDLDTFASILMLRPFGIDKRHVSVRLPISDENWFSENYIDSEIIRLDKELDWAGLCPSPNQHNRAWYIVTNTLLARVHDRLLLRAPLSVEEYATLANEISCLRIALPPITRSGTMYLDSESDIASKNWIIGCHLLLTAASDMVFRSYPVEQATSISQDQDESARQQHRVLEISALLRMWPPECLSSAHPFWPYTLCAFLAFSSVNAVDAPAYRSFRNLCDMIGRKLAERWSLGQRALEIINLKDQDLNNYPELVKRYRFFAKPYFRQHDTRMDQTSSDSIFTGEEASGDVVLDVPLPVVSTSNESLVLDAYPFSGVNLNTDEYGGRTIDHPIVDYATSHGTISNDSFLQIQHCW